MTVTTLAKKPPRAAVSSERSDWGGSAGGGGAFGGAPDVGAGALGGVGPALAMPVQRCEACDEEGEREAEAPLSDLSAVQRAAAAEDEDEPTGEGGAAVQRAREKETEQRDEGGPPVQSAADGAGPTGAAAQRVAAGGVRSASTPLPSLGRIQPSFGRHDLSDVRVEVGGSAEPAARDLGARAYTTGRRIGFREPPNLRLAAHEAAHVVQQRRGVHLDGGVGQAGDPYERQADRVADAVVAGRSAEPILDDQPVRSGRDEGVQRCACGGTCAECRQEQEDEEAVQMQLEVNATRRFEAPAARAAVEGGGGGGGGGGETEAGAEGEGEAEAEAEEGGEEGGESALAEAEAGETSATEGAAAEGAGGTEGGGAEGTPAGAQAETVGEGEEGCQGGSILECYREGIEEPEEEPDEEPEDHEATESQEEMESDSPEAEDNDECPIGDAVAAQAPGQQAALVAAPASGGGEGGAAGGESAGGPAAAVEGGGGAPAPAQAATETATETAASVDGALSPIDAQIALTEGQRGEAVAAYAASSARLAAAGVRTSGLAGAVAFAADPVEAPMPDQIRRAARNRARAFFASASARIEAVRARALEEIPARLGGLAEAIKAGIGAAIEAEKASISGRVAAARGQAAAEAAAARAVVDSQHAATVAVIESETALAFATLPPEHLAAITSVDAGESEGLATINEIYATSRAAHEAKGPLVGGEATAIGQEYVDAYEGCKIYESDGFFIGHLTDRRAEAQQDAARETSSGYAGSLTSAAQTQAGEMMKGRQKDRCGVIATARQARASLDDQLAGLMAAVESGRAQALAQADAGHAGLLAQIDGSLASTLAMLDEQERSQRQAANDTGYLQQVAVEQAAHSAAASAQEAVAEAVEGIESGLIRVRSALSAQTTPDPVQLGGLLGGAEAALGRGLDGLSGQLEQATAQSEASLLATHGQALAALAGVTQNNNQQADTVASGFSASMAQLTGAAIEGFSAQMSGYAEQTQLLTADGIAGFQAAVTGFDETVTEMTTNVETTLLDSEQRLEDSLREKLPELDCEIPRRANQAAAREAPAWKTVVAVILIIAVIVVVALVIGPAVIGAVGAAAGALGAGAAAGTIGTLVGGAIVGAAASATIQVINNWRTNQDLSTGVGQAAIMGAIGGFLGAGAGALVGRAFTTAATQALSVGTRQALQFAANIASDAVLEVGTQLVTTGTVSWESFGTALAMSIATGGTGEFKGVRRVQARMSYRGGRLVPGTGARVHTERARLSAESQLGPLFGDAAGPAPRAVEPPAAAARPVEAAAPEAGPRPAEAEAPTRAAEGEGPTRPAEAEGESRTPPAETEADSLPPRDVEGEATRPTRVGDEDHGITPRTIGERTELWMCSAACAPVKAKLDAMIEGLPAGTPLRTELEALKARVDSIEARMVAGQANVDVVREAADIARAFRDVSSRHPQLGAILDDPHLVTRQEGGVEPRLEPTAHLRDLEAEISSVHRKPVSEANTFPIRPGDEAIYILRHPESGAILKVGLARNHPGRFDQYANAANKLGLDLELEVAIVRPRADQSLEDIEGALRSRLEGEGHVMPWDNSLAGGQGRLGSQPRQGTPFVHHKDPNLMWDAHGNTVQRGSGAPVSTAPRRIRSDALSTPEQIAELLSRGMSNRQIAEHLGVSESAVRGWRSRWSARIQAALDAITH